MANLAALSKNRIDGRKTLRFSATNAHFRHAATNERTAQHIQATARPHRASATR